MEKMMRLQGEELDLKQLALSFRKGPVRVEEGEEYYFLLLGSQGPRGDAEVLDAGIGEAQAAYDQFREPKRLRPLTPSEQAVGARLEPGDTFGNNPATGAYQIYNVDTKKWRSIQ